MSVCRWKSCDEVWVDEKKAQARRETKQNEKRATALHTNTNTQTQTHGRTRCCSAATDQLGSNEVEHEAVTRRVRALKAVVQLLLPIVPPPQENGFLSGFRK